MVVTLAAVKLVEASLRVKETVAVWPMRTVDALLVIETVGAIVSIVSDGLNTPAVLLLPAASVNEPAATATEPGAVASAVGVNVAEYEKPEPLRGERVPPLTATSAAVKLVANSLNVKVTVAVSPLLREVLLLVIATLGAAVSTVIENSIVPLPFPAASVKLLAGMERTPGAVELDVGVNVAE